MIGLEKHRHHNQFLQNVRDEQPFLIAAHRGQYGANIMENSLEAALLTAKFQAEMMELDLALAKDGQFVGFHTHNEQRVFGENFDLESLTITEILQKPLLNQLGEKTAARIQLIANVFLNGPENLIYQLDRGWPYLHHLLLFLDQFDESIKQRLLIKIPLQEEYFAVFEKHEYKYMCMPILNHIDQLKVINQFDDVNVCVIEILAEDESSPVFGSNFIQTIHQEYHSLVQINSIRLNDETKLYAGLDDNLSLLQDPQLGWGKLYQIGADIIQTDWVLPLAIYRNKLKNNVN